MVDHNEIHQSVPGAREARIVEIIDHHRFGAEKTNTPIYIASKPVVPRPPSSISISACTSKMCPGTSQSLLQSGIISDTVNLKSPTTTAEDKKALKELELLSGLASDEYAVEMFSQLKASKNGIPGISFLRISRHTTSSPATSVSGRWKSSAWKKHPISARPSPKRWTRWPLSGIWTGPCF
jgi:hypothetical protein